MVFFIELNLTPNYDCFCMEFQQSSTQIEEDSKGNWSFAVFLPSDMKYFLPLVHILLCWTLDIRTHLFHLAMFAFDFHLVATVSLESNVLPVQINWR